MTETTLAAELWWVALSALLMLVTILPYVLDRITTTGFSASVGNPQDNEIPQSTWAIRMKAAHYNMVENMAVFAPLAIIIGLSAGMASGGTATACAVFFFARLVYLVVYTLGIPILRTLAFLVGWAATLYLAFAVLGAG